MRQTIPQGGRADAASLEGFTRRSLADYLAPLDLSEAQLDTIASMISVRGGCEVFTAERAGALGEAARRSCLVDGPHRSIALGETIQKWVLVIPLYLFELLIMEKLILYIDCRL